MPNLIIFGENHEDPASCQSLVNALPLLKQSGFTTLYLEAKKGRSIEAIIKDIETLVEVLHLFPNEVPEPSSGSKAQNDYIERNKDLDINAIVASQRNYIKCLEAKLLVLQRTKLLGMELVCIDVEEDPDSYNAHAGLIQERRKIIFSNLVTHLKNSNGILLFGLSHIIDEWDIRIQDMSYDRGIINMLLNYYQGKCYVRAYFMFSTNMLPRVQKNLDAIAACSEKIFSRVTSIGIDEKEARESKKFLRRLNEDIKPKAIDSRDVSVGLHKYWVRVHPKWSKSLLAYVEDLGGKIIQKDTIGQTQFVIVGIASSVLTPARLKGLFLHRISVPKLPNELLLRLQEDKGMTVEVISSNLQDSRAILTFPAQPSLIQSITDLISSVTKEDPVDAGKPKLPVESTDGQPREGASSSSTPSPTQKVDIGLQLRQASAKNNLSEEKFLDLIKRSKEAKEIDSKSASNGKTALHWATDKGHQKIVSVLLEAKADITIRDTQGKTVLDYAKEEGREQIKMLLEGGTAAPITTTVPVKAPS